MQGGELELTLGSAAPAALVALVALHSSKTSLMDSMKLGLSSGFGVAAAETLKVKIDDPTPFQDKYFPIVGGILGAYLHSGSFLQSIAVGGAAGYIGPKIFKLIVLWEIASGSN